MCVMSVILVYMCRSVSMDSWNDKQVHSMRRGGNDALNSFLLAHNAIRPRKADSGESDNIVDKYNAPAALLYKDRLRATIDGTDLPTDISKYAPSTNSAASNGGKALAQGSDPLPGETNDEYVLRQRLLQEDARERMRQKFGASNGLKATGKMAGIGSDSSYNPNAPAADISQQFSAVTLNAYSFLSSSISVIGESVKSATAANTNDASGNGSRGTSGDGKSKGWAAMTTTAVGFFQQAAEATSDLVQSITTPEEEACRFPRTNAAIASKGSAEVPRSSSSSYLSAEIPSDSLPIRPKTPDTVFIAAVNTAGGMSRSGSRDVVQQSSPIPPKSPSVPTTASAYRTSADPSPYSTNSSSPVTVGATVGGGGKSAKKLPVEENDDFFGSFGMK